MNNISSIVRPILTKVISVSDAGSVMTSNPVSQPSTIVNLGATFNSTMFGPLKLVGVDAYDAIQNRNLYNE